MPMDEWSRKNEEMVLRMAMPVIDKCVTIYHFYEQKNVLCGCGGFKTLAEQYNEARI